MLIALIVSFFVVLAGGMPIAFAMLVASIFAVMFLNNIPFILVVQKMFYGMDSTALLAVPLFLLAGELMSSGGITKRLIVFANACVGHIRGNLLHVSVVASMIFAGVSGSAIADAATMSRILVPAMREHGFDDDIAVSVSAASATIGPVIPPSIFLVLYSSITSVSIGRLFMAGIIPGLLMGAFQILMSYIYAIKRNYPSSPLVTVRQFLSAIRQSIFAILAPVIILYGVTSGIFNATEAGGIACLYTLLVSIGYREMSLKIFLGSLERTGKVTATILIILAAANNFTWFMSYGGFPDILAGLLHSITDNLNVTVLLFMGLMIFLGLIIEGNALLFILAPMVYPIIVIQMGYDGVQFGILFLLLTCVGALTPPVGTVLYSVTEVIDSSLQKVGKTIWFFCLSILLVAIMVAYLPFMTLWLPSLINF